MSVNFTELYLDKLDKTADERLSGEVLHQAKRCLIDYLGVTLAGSRILDKKNHLLMEHFGGFCDTGVSPIGYSEKLPPRDAAFINGLSAHVAELDDGVISGIVHPGSPILSALLPLAKLRNVEGIDLLRAIVMGYEASVLIAEVIQPQHKRLGYHATGTCGAVGAVIGLCSMLKLSKLETRRALSAVTVTASGSLKVLEDNSELKPYNVAKAADAAITGLFMSLSGFEGADDPLGGDYGFLAVLSGGAEIDLLGAIEAESEHLAIERVYVKPHAACRYCHSAIDAVLSLKESNDLVLEDLQSINVATYELAVKGHDHRTVDGVSSARMSIPYSVAAALVNGSAALDDFSESQLADPEKQRIAQMVDVRVSDDLSALFPDKCAAVVTLVTKAGESIKQVVENPKGDPEVPLSDREIEQKYASLAEFSGQSKVQIKQTLSNLWNIESNLEGLFNHI